MVNNEKEKGIIMPRKPRTKSNTGIYHIFLRGANRQSLFQEEEDSRKFMEILARYSTHSEAQMYGWCLMGNHVHLLMGEGTEELSLTMKRIGVSYAWYFNSKYNAVGHLFQDRFCSENVEDERYLLTLIRYIHQNPVKAGMVERVDEWKWSSCRGYYGRDYFPRGLLNPDLILGLFSDNKQLAVAHFKQFNEAENSDKCLDDQLPLRMTDEQARERILSQIKGVELAQVKSLPKFERDEIIRKVKGIEGVTQRQAARLLGVSPNIVFKV